MIVTIGYWVLFGSGVMLLIEKIINWLLWYIASVRSDKKVTSKKTDTLLPLVLFVAAAVLKYLTS